MGPPWGPLAVWSWWVVLGRWGGPKACLLLKEGDSPPPAGRLLGWERVKLWHGPRSRWPALCRGRNQVGGSARGCTEGSGTQPCSPHL